MDIFLSRRTIHVIYCFFNLNAHPIVIQRVDKIAAD